MDAELRFHIEMETEQFVRRGLSPAEAHRQALIRFGGVERYREQLRSGRSVVGLEEALRSVRFASRSLRRTPGMSAAIVAALALGIGVCTVVFSMAQAVWMDAVPFPHPEELVSFELLSEGSFGVPTLDEYRRWEPRMATSMEMAAHRFGSRAVGSVGATIDAWSLGVTGNFFAVLQPKIALGRALLPSDEHSSTPVAVISDRLWGELFASDSAALGAALRIGGQVHTLVGVLEVGQEFPAPVDAWTLLSAGSAESDRGVSVIARIRNGAADNTTWQTALQSLHANLTQDPESRVVVLPVTGRENGAVQPVFLLLAIAVGSILLIGVANAAGLMLTRSLLRRAEMVVRTVLGAGKRHLVGSLLVESLLLAGSASVVGVLLAGLALEGLRRIVPASLTRQILGWEQLGLDPPVLGFAVVLSLVAGVACGLGPAIGAGRGDLSSALQPSAGRVTSSRRSNLALSFLVAGEVALSLALLLTAGLLGTNLAGQLLVNAGFTTSNVVTVSWALPTEVAEPEDRLRLQEGLARRLAATPGVGSVALASSTPVAAAGLSATRAYRLPATEPARSDGRVSWRSVSPQYFETLDIPLISGRLFTVSDARPAPRVLLISETLARRHWREGESPLGTSVVIGEDSWTIVGVVGDVRTFRPGETVLPTVYVSQAQEPTLRGVLVAGAPGTRAGDLASVRRGLWATHPNIALGELRTLDDVLDDLFAGDRLLLLLVGVYAVSALIVTLISLYAVVGHSVVRHGREYRIRMALGASHGDMVRRAVWDGMRAAVVGVIGGVLIALAIARLIQSIVVTDSLSPRVFIGLSLLALAFIAAAAYVPARRAVHLDPAATLEG